MPMDKQTALSLGLIREDVCDSCEQVVHKDRAGYWVGEDESSDCSVEKIKGHSVGGRIR